MANADKSLKGGICSSSEMQRGETESCNCGKGLEVLQCLAWLQASEASKI